MNVRGEITLTVPSNTTGLDVFDRAATAEKPNEPHKCLHTLRQQGREAGCHGVGDKGEWLKLEKTRWWEGGKGDRELDYGWGGI